MDSYRTIFGTVIGGNENRGKCKLHWIWKYKLRAWEFRVRRANFDANCSSCLTSFHLQPPSDPAPPPHASQFDNLCFRDCDDALRKTAEQYSQTLCFWFILGNMTLGKNCQLHILRKTLNPSSKIFGIFRLNKIYIPQQTAAFTERMAGVFRWWRDRAARRIGWTLSRWNNRLRYPHWVANTVEKHSWQHCLDQCFPPTLTSNVTHVSCP